MAWKDVVLLEREQLTSGPTRYASGPVGQLKGGHSTTAFAKYGMAQLREIEAETGQHPGFRQSGSISIAANSNRLAELKRKADFATHLGVESQYPITSRIAERWPPMNATAR